MMIGYCRYAARSSIVKNCCTARCAALFWDRHAILILSKVVPGQWPGWAPRGRTPEQDRCLARELIDYAQITGGIVLSGGYLEQRKTGAGVTERVLGAGSVNRLTGEDFHRIVLPRQQQAWTFFMHSARVRDWGFLTTDGSDNQTFTPHNQVNNEGTHNNWWKRASRGRHAGREPLDISVS